VLEVGCGAGWLWADAVADVPAGLDLTLTDLSPGMVAEAVERAAALGTFASVTGRPADVQDLPFASAAFAVVASNHMLYHVPDPAQGVAEIARVLRPDGTAAVATNGWSHLTELWQIRAEIFPELDDHDETVEVFGIETGEAILRARFGSVELRRYPDVLRCTDPADVVAFIASTPPTDTAGPEALEHLRTVVARRFDEGGGVLEVTKETGLFLCADPR
jgi:SAM-dependent methyltransferase